jgi:hypothetical protein
MAAVFVLFEPKLKISDNKKTKYKKNICSWLFQFLFSNQFIISKKNSLLLI